MTTDQKGLQDLLNSETITNSQGIGDTPPSDSVSADGKIDNPDNQDVVARKTYVRTVDEVKALKTERESLKQSLAAFENEKKTREEKELKKRNNYEQILKNRDDELKAKEQELAMIKSRLESGRKMDALLNALPGQLPKEYWSLVDLEEIIVNPDDQKVDEISVQNYAKSFAERYMRVLDSGNNSKLPKTAPQPGKSIPHDEWRNLNSSKEMLANMPADVFKMK